MFDKKILQNLFFGLLIVSLIVITFYPFIIGLKRDITPFEKEGYLDLVVPDPTLVHSSSNILILDDASGISYSFLLKDTSYEIFLKYSNLCKEYGFKYISFKSDDIYQAYTSNEKYWIFIKYDMDLFNKRSYIYVDVQYIE